MKDVTLLLYPYTSRSLTAYRNGIGQQKVNKVKKMLTKVTSTSDFSSDGLLFHPFLLQPWVLTRLLLKLVDVKHL